MLSRSDLRLAPAALALWILAVIGVRGGLAVLCPTILAALSCLLLIGVLSRRLAVVRRLLAHLGVVVLGLALLVPALSRHEAAVSVLERASSQGLVLEVEVEALTQARSPSSGPSFSREDVQLRARTLPGNVRVGRDSGHLGQVAVLVRASGAAAGDLAGVDAGERVRMRAAVRVHGDLVVLDVHRAAPLSSEPSWRGMLRDRARQATAHLPADEGALLRGMTTGDTEGLSPATEDIMRRAGIQHIVAVSGANIAFVLAAVLVPLLLVGVPRRPRLALAALVVGGYVLLVGPEPSVLRASTMAVPLLIARFVGVRASPVAALAFTLAVWSALDPVTSASVGFVLSALATAAILVLAPPLSRVIVELGRGRIGEAVALVLAVPLVAQAACTPVLILLSPEISLWAVPVNLVVGPLVGPATVLGLVAVVVGAVSVPAAAAICDMAVGGAHLVLLVAVAADTLPGSRISVPEGGAGALSAVLVLAAAVLAILGRRRRPVRFAVALVLVASLAPPLALRLPVDLSGRQGDWIVAACAVGQGDAVLLRAEETTVLVDTGPDPAALTDCLDALGVRSIDLLILTHPHADHVGGNAALRGGRTPARQWICPLPEARDRTVPSVPATAVARGEELSAPGLDLVVLWPPDAETARAVSARESGGGEGDAANDCSLVIAATWSDGTRYVGLGDLEPKAQEQLRRLGPGDADIVKIAHHGSARQDPDLYAELDPEAVLVTVGAENSFGHPSDAAIAIARRSTGHIGRTDRHGTVLVPPGDITDLRGVGGAR
ncbi:ComEC/Rec2 family competence protein [Brachybacterium hainanense]|uniref:ComEC/Rec2 family competence protein n=1 Tax=Brachybacterium hainanense TaxID=1541174 RepID=A0ABV6RA96_9MICO